MTTTDASLLRPAVAGRLGDSSGALPLVAVDIEAAIGGLAVTTTVRQTFRNTRATGIEATYIFPLPDRAGVTAFTADLAGRRVDADLRERAQARAEYDAAIAAGHRAAIAEEERADVFSIRVGNLQPGEEAVITLTVTGPLALDEGTAEYRFPLVVAPRYVAGQPLPWPPVGPGTVPDTDAVPDASRITPPVLLPGQDSPVRLSLRARLYGLGLDPGDVRSSLHAVTTAAAGGDSEPGGTVDVVLQPGERLDRDVILRFGVAGAVARTVAAAAPDDGDARAGTWQVTVVPPAAAEADRTARDVVVVLDRSGSMGGWKIVAARRAAARIVDSLGAADRFAVLAFDNVTERPPLPGGLVPASDVNRWAAVSWLASLEARGGTEMAGPLSEAAATLAAVPATPDERRERFLILVTDGQVGAEDQILAVLAPAAGGTRIFTLGIDRAVNAGFLRRLAALGAGRCELVESEDRLDEVMAGLHRRVSPPLVTGLRVEASGAELVPGQTTPARAPDLFPGAPCTLSGRWRATTALTSLTLTVLADGGFAEQVSAVVAPDRAVRACWARARVRELEDRYAAGGASPELAEEIVTVSLGHQVLSRFTAFVAVDRSRAADHGAPQPVIQPVELPSGWAPAGAAAGGAGLESMELSAHAGVRAYAARGCARARSAASAPLPAASAAALRGGAPGPARPAPAFGPAELTAYQGRAADLFDRIERDLALGHDLGPAAAAVRDLADDLISVSAPGDLTGPLRRLASVLDEARTLPDAAARRDAEPLRSALAQARRAFGEDAGAGAPASPGAQPATAPSRPGPPRERRTWWR